MTLSRRWLVIGIAIALILGALVAIAPSTGSPSIQGSTFSRAPTGYGAWYAYMEAQGVNIQRWQRPPEALSSLEADAPITLLQVVPPNLQRTSARWNSWISQGNRLIVLTSQQTATAAPFSSRLESAQGLVSVETRRRYEQLADDEAALLSDRYGAVVWRSPVGAGELIQATTPYLGANAYQDAPSNFAFLADLVTDSSASNSSSTIWVDEYLHGYKDLQPEDAEPQQRSWAAYLAGTSLLVIGVQAMALCLLLLWRQRLGPPAALQPPQRNNSEAYITALASVLRRAKSAGFVMETVTKAERLRLQKALGLGSTLVDEATLVEAWVKHQRSPADLKQLLQFGQSSPSDRDLAAWLKALHTVRYLEDV